MQDGQQSGPQQPMHVGEHALLGLQAVGKVQQDAKEAIGYCQKQDDALQARALARQLRQGQRKDCAQHHDDHNLHGSKKPEAASASCGALLTEIP